MFKISVWHGNLSESYLRFVTQLGVDCLDFGQGNFFPGVKEQGYPDLDDLLKIKRKIQSWGLNINRVTLPDITNEFMKEKDGSERELENSVNALRVFAEAGIPIARQRLEGDVFPWMSHRWNAPHRGDYRYRSESLALANDTQGPPTAEELEKWWTRFCDLYSKLVPIAEDYNIKLAIHPSDAPFPDTPLGSLGYHRVIDAFPSKQVGYLYCCGTRAQAGGSPLVLDELHNYGRKGRLFMIHLRNVRGSLATAGGFEEVLLDDGDMNPAKILIELKRINFDGCINPDHIPALEGDEGNLTKGMAYSVGYLKALFAAMAVLQ
tara:strand:- start:270 stop:1232 length:963 start_codon:yes stop_codon:yes gene_type:complete